MVALPILGALVAIIGLAIMFALLRADTTEKQEPLLNTVETSLRDTAHKLLATWDSPPPLSLTYDVPKTAGSAQSLPFSITATNKSEKAITLNRTTMTLEVGGDDACLFSAPPTFTLAADPDPATLVTGVLTPEPGSTTLISYDFAVAGRWCSARMPVSPSRGMASSTRSGVRHCRSSRRCRMAISAAF
jgi:hypothetical protein